MTSRFDLDAFLSMPRLGGLACAPDGSRVVVGAGLPDAKNDRFATALWELDPAGARPARRLTRAHQGESMPAFTPDGDLLFTSTRPAPSPEDDEKPPPRLWLLPAGGGDPRLVADAPGGVRGFRVARGSGDVALLVPVHPAAADWEADREREEARSDAGVSAQLVTSYPARFWDAWLGVREPRLHVGTVDASDAEVRWRDLTPDPGRGLEQASIDISADGVQVAATWWRHVEDPTERVCDIVLVDAASGDQRVLVEGGDRVSYEAPCISPDGRQLACLRHDYGEPDRPGTYELVVVDIATGELTRLAGDLDRWPQAPVWMPDGQAILFTADDDGRTLPFRVDLGSGEVRRLAAEGVYTELTPAPHGDMVLAIRSDVATPHEVVALDPSAGDQDPRVLQGPPSPAPPPGRVERVETRAADGTRVPGWLILPPEPTDEPAPLVVFIHGGPFSSWAGWHWRWNPHLLAARGWAVLCPDPALSTGYGQDFIARGWGRWGAEPYTDLMALVEAVADRPEIDGTRAAAMGGSFGGYMANWVAGQTDRFKAIVTHASLWNLEAFHGTTDLGVWWEREFGDPYADASRYREWSPRQHIGRIRTPMLVIHGERDFRVPVSEGLTLWTDLRRHGVTSAYLHFPDENHWILRPGNVRAWYSAVFAWLDEHVLGEPNRRPDLL